jgi:uncharacterized membrane protein
LAVIVDLVALTVPKASWAETTASFLYPAGALSAAVAFLSGHQAAATVLMPGMAHPLLLQHWNWALATTVGLALLAVVRLLVRFRRPQSSRWVRSALVAAALVALVSLFEAGDRGARLVYEHGVGVITRGGSR